MPAAQTKRVGSMCEDGTFEPIASFDFLIRGLRNKRNPASPGACGEGVAMAICSKSSSELAEMVKKMDEVDDGTGDKLVDVLFAAHADLEARLEFVTAAIARLSGIAEGWPKPRRRAPKRRARK